MSVPAYPQACPQRYQGPPVCEPTVRCQAQPCTSDVSFPSAEHCCPSVVWGGVGIVGASEPVDLWYSWCSSPTWVVSTSFAFATTARTGWYWLGGSHPILLPPKWLRYSDFPICFAKSCLCKNHCLFASKIRSICHVWRRSRALLAFERPWEALTVSSVLTDALNRKSPSDTGKILKRKEGVFLRLVWPLLLGHTHTKLCGKIGEQSKKD